MMRIVNGLALFLKTQQTFDFQNYSCYFCITKHKTTKSNK